jgi:hypothetical protein
MNVTITKSCNVQLDGVVKSLQAYARLNLPDDKAKKLIDAGFAEPANVTEEARAMVEEFGLRDPGGECWTWIRQELPDVWRDHLKAMRISDLDKAKATFNEMLSAWERREAHGQLNLLAA